jgi:DNA-directed RNA polymerase beta subunit
MYISKLEHLGSEKIYARGTGPVTGKVSQPTSGKKREGGQRLGELDTYSFISYNCPSVLAEFMGPLSDDYITKEEIMAEVVQKGNAGYKEPKISPARELLNSYFISLMLKR